MTDSAGRTVELPDAVERVYAAGPPASADAFWTAARVAKIAIEEKTINDASTALTAPGYGVRLYELKVR